MENTEKHKDENKNIHHLTYQKLASTDPEMLFFLIRYMFYFRYLLYRALYTAFRMCFYISLDIFKIILTLTVIYYSTVWIRYYIRNHTDIKLFGLSRIILYYKYYHSGHLCTCISVQLPLLILKDFI